MGFLFWLGIATPLQPFRLFGERKPIACNLFERLSNVRLGCLCCALLPLHSATAVLFSARVHLIANALNQYGSDSCNIYDETRGSSGKLAPRS
jgi:hypothetical protein